MFTLPPSPVCHLVKEKGKRIHTSLLFSYHLDPPDIYYHFIDLIFFFTWIAIIRSYFKAGYTQFKYTWYVSFPDVWKLWKIKILSCFPCQPMVAFRSSSPIVTKSPQLFRPKMFRPSPVFLFRPAVPDSAILVKYALAVFKRLLDPLLIGIRRIRNCRSDVTTQLKWKHRQSEFQTFTGPFRPQVWP